MQRVMLIWVFAALSVAWADDDALSMLPEDAVAVAVPIPATAPEVVTTVDGVLRVEASGVRWCYRDEAKQLPPGVEAVAVVLFAVDEEGKMSVMSRDEVRSTVGSDDSDACVNNYLRKYRAGQEERNKMIVKKTIFIRR